MSPATSATKPSTARSFRNLAEVRAAVAAFVERSQPVLAPRKAGVSHATRSPRAIRVTPCRIAQMCVQETGCGTMSDQWTSGTRWTESAEALNCPTCQSAWTSRGDCW